MNAPLPRPNPFIHTFSYTATAGLEQRVSSALEALARHGLSVTDQTEELASNVSREQLFGWRADYLSRFPEYTVDDVIPLTEERIALITKPVKITTTRQSSPDGALVGSIRFCDQNEYAMGWDGFWVQEELVFLGGCVRIEGATPEQNDQLWFALRTAWGLPTTSGGVCRLRSKDLAENDEE